MQAEVVTKEGWGESSDLDIESPREEEQKVEDDTPADMNVIIRKLGRLPKCSFARDREGIFALTHRARSKSYASASKISKSAIEFVESTV